MGTKRIYGMDSDGRMMAVEKKHLRTLLKNRLAKHVTPEVREVIERRRRKGHRKISVQDLGLELGVRFLTIRKILNEMSVSGETSMLDRHDAHGVYEIK